MMQELDKFNGSSCNEDEDEDADQKLLLSTEESIPEKKKTFLGLGQVNWRNLSAATCLWLTYGICSAAFSLLGPFFPEEVTTLIAAFSAMEHN